MSLLPRVEIELRNAPSVPNPNDTACIAGVIGCASDGPIGVLRSLTKIGDCTEFGNGPGIELAAAILARAGGPVRFMRTATGTAGTLSAGAKYPVLVDPGLLYGGLLLPGADANGEVFVTALVSGLSIIVVNPGADGSLGHTKAGGLITITLAYAMGAVTTTATQLATYINASITAYLVAIAQGTGASLTSAMSETAIANGDISYLPRQSGVRVRHTAAGNNTALSVSVSTKDITVALATDANGTPTSTATAVAAAFALSSAAMLLASPTASGTGAGKAGVWGYTALTYGSTAALSLSGTPVDAFDGEIECVQGGTVGASPAPTVRWTLDRGAHWSPETPLPSTGVLILQDSTLISGVTATFTGILAADDAWTFTTTAPTATQADLVAAAEAIIDAPAYPVGFVAVAQPVARADAAEIDTAVRALFAGSWSACMVSVRDETATEAPADWRTSVGQDYFGYYSPTGILRVCAGYAPHASSLTRRTYHRPLIFLAAPSRAAAPVHMNIGEVQQHLATSGGTTLVMGGSILGLGAPEPGRQTIGGLLYVAKMPGVAVQHYQQTGNTLPLLVGVATSVTARGTRYTITVSLGTDGGGAINSTRAQVAAAVAAVASRYVAVSSSSSTVVTATAYPVEIAERQITHDEFLAESLHAQRFITARSYKQHPGGIYFTGAPTFADPSASGYTTMETADVVYSVARIADSRGYRWINTVLPDIPIAESELVPAGALTVPAAEAVASDISTPIEAFLFRPKLDGRQSAAAYPPGDRAARPLRDYSHKDSRELRVAVGVWLLGLTEVVRLIVEPR